MKFFAYPVSFESMPPATAATKITQLVSGFGTVPDIRNLYPTLYHSQPAGNSPYTLVGSNSAFATCQIVMGKDQIRVPGLCNTTAAFRRIHATMRLVV